jgi:hypothetical protein
VREVVLAQRNQYPVVGATEVETLDERFLEIQHGLQRLGRPVLHQVGQVLDELRRALAPEVVVLPEREDLLELVEDQQRRERLAGGVAQQVVAVVQELPQRLARDGGAGTRPLPLALGGAEDRLLDLLGGRRGLARVVDAHVHRAVAIAAKARHDPGTQYRGLAEARLAEEDGEELPLHAAGELADLLLAPVEEPARLLRERVETQPGVFGIDEVQARGDRCDRLDARLGDRAHVATLDESNSFRRSTNPAGGSPPGMPVMCSARKRSGTRAIAALVSSMQAGRMKIAPSAMLRVRSMA